MKTQINFSLILLGAISLLLACSTSDNGPDNNMNTSADIQQISTNAQSGTWQITSFIDSGQNETSDFTNYNFTFNSNGTVMAVNGGTTVNGTWSVTDSSGSSDDSNDDIDFNLLFNVPMDDPFEDLNDDWDIVSYTSTMISLIDISGGNGGTDTLVFQKN